MKPKKPHVGEVVIYWIVRDDNVIKMPGLVLNIYNDNIVDLVVFRNDTGQSQYYGNVKYNIDIEDKPESATWTYISMVPERESESTPTVVKKGKS